MKKEFTVIFIDRHIGAPRTVYMSDNKRADVFGLGNHLLGVRFGSSRPTKAYIAKSILERAETDAETKEWLEKGVLSFLHDAEIIYY